MPLATAVTAVASSLGGQPTSGPSWSGSRVLGVASLGRSETRGCLDPSLVGFRGDLSGCSLRDKRDYRAANGRAQTAVLPPSPGLAFRPWRRFSRRSATGRAESCPRPYLRPPPLHGHPLHWYPFQWYGYHSYGMHSQWIGLDWYAMHCNPFHTNG